MPSEIVLKGIGICPGIAIGPPFVFTKTTLEICPGLIEDKDITNEVARYRRAIQKSHKELEALRRDFLQDLVGEGLALIDAHLVLLRDPEWMKSIEEYITEQKNNAEAAILATLAHYKECFSRLKDPLFQSRFTDIQDVANRLLKALSHRTKRKIDKLPPSAVFFSDEISTSDTFWTKKAGVIGFVSRKGGPTCHAAIMARAQGLPYIVGVDVSQVPVDILDTVIVDGETGVIILNPTLEHRETFYTRQKELKAYESKKLKDAAQTAVTACGIPISVKANVDYSDKLGPFNHAIDGIGLFRSESIVMDLRLMPSEEEQFIVYKELLDKMGQKPVVIRTFDLGGDKNVHHNTTEDNPFLGCRATRLLLREKHLLRAQLRAILRASHFGTAHILFPMICALDELLEVLSVLDDVKQELRESHVAFNEKIPIGCMIEVPSAALIVDKIMRHCDFLSIGTNDLVQYTIAVDRGNSLLNHLYNPLHPAVLRLIEHVSKEAALKNCPLSVCGEMASDVRYLPYLLGLGIKEISVNPRLLHTVKEAISQITLLDARELAVNAL